MGTCNVTLPLINENSWSLNMGIYSATMHRSRIIPHLAARKREAQRAPVTRWIVATIWSTAWRAPMPPAFCCTSPTLLAEDSSYWKVWDTLDQWFSNLPNALDLGSRPNELYKVYMPQVSSHTVFGEQTKLCLQPSLGPVLWLPASCPEGHWFLWTLTLLPPP